MAAQLRRGLRRALAVLALLAVVNLAFAPALRAAALARSPASVADVAADLKAAFGDAFALCVHVGDDGSAPAPAPHCDEGCPLCCLHGAAHFLAPDAKPLPLRLAERRAEPIPSETAAPPPPARASPAQPRAPPPTRM